MAEPEGEDSNLFYFESDHLAVKGNKDYSELLKTLFILQAQQQRALKDYEKVEKIRQECLRDPLGTVERLKNGETLGIPDLQVIAEIPEINWSNYDVAAPEEGLKMIDSDALSYNNKETKPAHCKDDKGETHNRPWSTEEQKRLEELLLIYPPEPIELRRFKKIAAALGNRTVKQVSSRVQKYFLKLYKAGLPIPGRIPKSSAKYKKVHKHHRLNHFLWRPTTFFPELDVPVKMNELEEVPGPRTDVELPSTSQSNYLLPGSYNENKDAKNKSEVDCQLDLLKRIKHEKERLNNSDNKPVYHFGFKCDFCNEEPICGTRWHCTTCVNSSVDFCTDCLVMQMYSENSHPLQHRFAVVRGADEEPATSSDSETSISSEKIEEDNSSSTDGVSTMKVEYGLSDLEMDENSNGLVKDSERDEEAAADFSNQDSEVSSNFGQNSGDTPYDYLCSVINDAEVS